MKTWEWLSICFCSFSCGLWLGVWMTYGLHKKSSEELVEECKKHMDGLAADFQKIEEAYKSAARMVGINLDIGGTK